MESKLSNFNVKITKHLSLIESNVAVLKGDIVNLRERQIESSNFIERLVACVDDVEKQLLEQGVK